MTWNQLPKVKASHASERLGTAEVIGRRGRAVRQGGVDVRRAADTGSSGGGAEDLPLYRVDEDGRVEQVRCGNCAELETRCRELDDKAELLLHAVLPLLPVQGSWTNGYEPSETTQLTLTATAEEWGDAAYAFCELHAALADRLWPTGKEPR